MWNIINPNESNKNAILALILMVMYGWKYHVKELLDYVMTFRLLYVKVLFQPEDWLVWLVSVSLWPKPSYQQNLCCVMYTDSLDNVCLGKID